MFQTSDVTPVGPVSFTFSYCVVTVSLMASAADLSVLCFHAAVQPHSWAAATPSARSAGHPCPRRAALLPISVSLHTIFTYSYLNISSSSLFYYSSSQPNSNPSSFLKISPSLQPIQIFSFSELVFTVEKISTLDLKKRVHLFWDLFLFYWSIDDLQYSVSFTGCSKLIQLFIHICRYLHSFSWFFSIIVYYKIMNIVPCGGCILNMDCLIWWHYWIDINFLRDYIECLYFWKILVWSI